MSKWLLFVCLALAVGSPQRYAQFTEPHNYENTPIGVNQPELAYAYTHANTSLDTSLVVAGANFNLNQGSISYKRYFGFVHRLARVEASVPLAGLGGSVSGTIVHGSTTGVGLQLHAGYAAQGRSSPQCGAVRRLQADYYGGHKSHHQRTDWPIQPQ